jgi:hypothetical protein
VFRKGLTPAYRYAIRKAVLFRLSLVIRLGLVIAFAALFFQSSSPAGAQPASPRNINAPVLRDLEEAERRAAAEAAARAARRRNIGLSCGALAAIGLVLWRWRRRNKRAASGVSPEKVTGGASSSEEASVRDIRRKPGPPPGPCIRGAVEGIEVTQEPDVGGTSTIYRFHLQRYDQTTKQPIPPPIPVEMHGRSVNNAPAFDGSLNERDWVEIPGVWQGQILHPDRVYIIPRAAFFTSRGVR